MADDEVKHLYAYSNLCQRDSGTIGVLDWMVEASMMKYGVVEGSFPDVGEIGVFRVLAGGNYE